MTLVQHKIVRPRSHTTRGVTKAGTSGPKSPIPSLLWTPRAQRAFYAYAAGGQHRVVSVTRNSLRKHAELLDWHNGKKSVQGISENVYELRATDAHRILVQERHRQLVLVDVGDHRIVERYVELSAQDRKSQLDLAAPAPDVFDLSAQHPLFMDLDEGVDPHFDEELDDGWTTFLSDQQNRLVTDLLARLQVRPFRSADQPFIAYVRGGAGTGKTAVLWRSTRCSGGRST